MNLACDYYPCVDDIAQGEEGNSWIPKSLTDFMKHLVPITKKRISINQCIVQAARPRSVIAPVPFAIGVALDQSFGSKWLVNFISQFGFSISPAEVFRYKQSVADDTTKDQQRENLSTDSVLQWIGDNVDHNSATLTGKDTVHAMGTVMVLNRSENFARSALHKVPRTERRVAAKSASYNSGIPIKIYNRSVRETPQGLVLKPVEHSSCSSLLTDFCDLIWKCGRFFASEKATRPHWFGFMQASTSKFTVKQTKSIIEFQSMIDLSPITETCIYSTLIFFCRNIIKWENSLALSLLTSSFGGNLCK